MKCERCGNTYEPMQALENTQMDIYERVYKSNKYDTNAKRQFSWERKKLCPRCANEFQTLLHKPLGYLAEMEAKNAQLVNELRRVKEGR